MNSKYHFNLAKILKNNILSGKSNLSKLESWRQVSDQCIFAMQNWRAENPNFNDETPAKFLAQVTELFNEANDQIMSCF